ncbi:MAG: C25 family cysteine peptidase [Methanobacteriota archaeon]
MREKILQKEIVYGIVCLFVLLSIVPSIGSRNTLDENNQTINLHIDIPSITYGNIQTTQGIFATLDLPNYGYTTIVGEAKLPVITKILEIPYESTPSLTLSSVEWRTTSLQQIGLSNRILPVQPSIPKTLDGNKNTPFTINQNYYHQDLFFPETPARITEEGEIRGSRFILIEISPVQYNPVSGELHVMKSCDIQISLPGSDLVKTYTNKARYYSSDFNLLYQSFFDNYGQFNQGYAIGGKDQTGFLIIVPDVLYSAILPFANWKDSIGYEVTVTKTSQIPGGPTKENIHTYIDQAYQEWPVPPSFVLLAGDVPQIPTYTGSSSGTATDLYYVTISQGDIFPDIFIGRFPAATEAEMNIIVGKTLEYEQGTFPSTEWLGKAVFMASEDNWQVSEGTHNYVISTYLDPEGYVSDKLYCHTYSATTQQVINAHNDGRVISVYSGHGYSGGWADGPPFDQNNVRYDLTNAHMYPFVCSHACSTNPFDISECFGETWLRVPDKGGLAFWGSSASTYWDEDDILEKAMFHAWWVEGLWFLAGMTDKAKYDTWQHYSGGGLSTYYMECYNLLGDPSLSIKPRFLPEHNVAVTSIDVPSHVLPGQLVPVEATIANNGQNDEYNVLVKFLVDDEEIDTFTIPFSASQSFTQVNFEWTPLEIGVYLLTINVSIPGVIEDVYYDNEMSTLVVAGPDVAVTSITVNDYAAVGRLTIVVGTVANPGTTNELITVSFKENGVVLSTQQVFLSSGGSTNVNFNWVPTIPGTYPVSIAASIAGQEPYLGNNELSKNVSVFIANGYVLLVDDDYGESYETYYINALMACNYLYDRWDRSSQGSPSSTIMATYDAVIWFCGDDWSDTLDSTDQANLQNFLTNGGRFFLTSQEIGYDIGTTPFYTNYLHATYQVDDTNIYTLLGTVGDPIGDGLTLGISGGDGANNQNYPDGIQAISPGTVVFTYQSSAYKAAVKTDTAGYKVVYFAFGFEAINTQTSRNEVMNRVLEWLIGANRVTIEGYCYYHDMSPVNSVSVEIKNLNTGEQWEASTNNNHYSLVIYAGRDVNASETLRFTARDNDESVNVTDHVVTAGEISAKSINQNLILNVHYRDLKQFPFYTATMDTGAAIAQMMLNYLWWNSTLNPSGPPMHYADQQQLFTWFNTQGGLTLTTDEMCAGLNQFKPLPIDLYGYFFTPASNTSATVVLRDICIWLDFTYGVDYDHNGDFGYPTFWPKPGHPTNVPIAIPTYGNYNNWMTVRGIHTNRSAWQNYPDFPVITVYGFWLNDPKTGGLGGNTYVTTQQFLTTYFQPISIIGDTYKNKYVVITDPPEGVVTNTETCTVSFAETSSPLTPSEIKLVQTNLKRSGVLHDYAVNTLVTAARKSVENVLKYDQAELYNLFTEASVVGKPLYHGDTCIITFETDQVTFIVQLQSKTGVLTQFTINGI